MKTNCIRRCVQTFDWCIVLHLRVIFPSHLLFDHQLVALDNELQFVPFGSQRGQGVQAAAGHRSQQAVLLLSAREVGQDLHSDAQHSGRAFSTDRLKLRMFRLGRSSEWRAPHFRFARHDVAALGVGGADLLHALRTGRQRVRRLRHKSVYCLSVTCTRSRGHAKSELKKKKTKKGMQKINEHGMINNRTGHHLSSHADIQS